ncbi:MAG: hypothetical protein H8D45_15750 [Bacteroidetes bacterium]|nr:hypothetical protein [Bacteroidota bacterium]
MRKKKIIQGLPLFLLVIMVFYTLISGIIMKKSFTWNIYTGSISIIICLLLYFTRYRWFKYLFLIILLVGSFNILHFTFNEVTFSFSFGLFKFINVETIDIQLLSFSILIIFTILNKNKIIRLIKGYLYVADEQKRKEQKTILKSFEKKYSTLSKSDLQNIVDNKESYTIEAVRAAQRLLVTKYSNSSSNNSYV